MRTHNNGELRIQDVGKEVTRSSVGQQKGANLGGIIFMTSGPLGITENRLQTRTIRCMGFWKK